MNRPSSKLLEMSREDSGHRIREGKDRQEQERNEKGL